MIPITVGILVTFALWVLGSFVWTSFYRGSYSIAGSTSLLRWDPYDPVTTSSTLALFWVRLVFLYTDDVVGSDAGERLS